MNKLVNKNTNLIVKATERYQETKLEESDHTFAAKPKGNYYTGQMGRPNRFNIESVKICESAYKPLIG